MRTAGELGVTILVAVIGGIAIGLPLDWGFRHTTVFIVALATLMYWTGNRMGHEFPVRLESPLIGVPIIAILGVMLWWAHFGPNSWPRPVTLMIQVLTASPFAALTLMTLFRFD